MWWTHYYVIQATLFLHTTGSLLQSAPNNSELNDRVGGSNTISEYSLAESVLKNSSERGENTTAEKMKYETIIPPDNPLSSNSGVSLMVQEHGRTDQSEIIMNSR